MKIVCLLLFCYSRSLRYKEHEKILQKYGMRCYCLLCFLYYLTCQYQHIAFAIWIIFIQTMYEEKCDIDSQHDKRREGGWRIVWRFARCQFQAASCFIFMCACAFRLLVSALTATHLGGWGRVCRSRCEAFVSGIMGLILLGGNWSSRNTHKDEKLLLHDPDARMTRRTCISSTTSYVSSWRQLQRH